MKKSLKIQLVAVLLFVIISVKGQISYTINFVGPQAPNCPGLIYITAVSTTCARYNVDLYTNGEYTLTRQYRVIDGTALVQCTEGNLELSLTTGTIDCVSPEPTSSSLYHTMVSDICKLQLDYELKESNSPLICGSKNLIFKGNTNNCRLDYSLDIIGENGFIGSSERRVNDSTYSVYNLPPDTYELTMNDRNGCAKQQTLIIESCDVTGITNNQVYENGNKISYDSSFEIIRFEHQSSYVIFNAFGLIMMKGHDSSVSIAHLNQGVYLVVIDGVVQKLIKE